MNAYKNWPVLAISSGAALFMFAVFWTGFAFINRHKRGGFFLDPQDIRSFSRLAFTACCVSCWGTWLGAWR